jgi:hypothetical protein
MNVASLEAIVRALNAAGVRYLVAGGVAVAAHGYPRFTADVDLVVALQRENVLAALGALRGLGYRASVPISDEQFADRGERDRIRAEKGMMVLNLYSDAHRETAIDIFVTEPFDVEAEYAAAPPQEIGPDARARFVTIPTLIDMKSRVGRPRDLDDIEHLRMILEERVRGPGS